MRFLKPFKDTKQVELMLAVSILRRAHVLAMFKLIQTNGATLARSLGFNIIDDMPSGRRYYETAWFIHFLVSIHEFLRKRYEVVSQASSISAPFPGYQIPGMYLCFRTIRNVFPSFFWTHAFDKVDFLRIIFSRRRRYGRC